MSGGRKQAPDAKRIRGDVEEWSAGAGYRRLIPQTIFPLWDVELAVAEIQRCAAKGGHALAFSEKSVSDRSAVDPFGVLGPALCHLPGDADRCLHAYWFVVEDADHDARCTSSFGSHLPEPPTSYIRGRVLGCIFDDETGLANRERIGMDLITFEMDDPHADSTFPDTEEIATSICAKAGLNPEEIYALMRGNAIRAFGLARWGITK